MKDDVYLLKKLKSDLRAAIASLDKTDFKTYGEKLDMIIKLQDAVKTLEPIGTVTETEKQTKADAPINNITASLADVIKNVDKLKRYQKMKLLQSLIGDNTYLLVLSGDSDISSFDERLLKRVINTNLESINKSIEDTLMKALDSKNITKYFKVTSIQKEDGTTDVRYEFDFNNFLISK